MRILIVSVACLFLVACDPPAPKPAEWRQAVVLHQAHGCGVDVLPLLRVAPKRLAAEFHGIEAEHGRYGCSASLNWINGVGRAYLQSRVDFMMCSYVVDCPRPCPGAVWSYETDGWKCPG